MVVLLCGRTVQGVGGGGVFVMTSIVISDVVPLRERPKFQGIVAASWGLGAILGPLCGGLFAEHTTWRVCGTTEQSWHTWLFLIHSQWLFYVNFPFFVIGFALIPFFRLRLIKQESLLANLARVDWLGNGLFILGMTAFLIGLTWGGVQYPWSSYKTWLPILLGALVVIGSIIYEKFVSVEPFFRISVFRNRSAIITFILTFIQGLIVSATL